MDQKTSVSVIIPTYNSARFISEAIGSIFHQTVKAHEIIVVDDGSADDTETIIKNMEGNIRYEYQENAGVAAARNRGLELARGDLIGFIDADDIWLKNKLEIQVNVLRKNPEYEMAVGLVYRIPLSKTQGALNKINGKGEYATHVGSALFQKQVFGKVGNFDEEMKFGEDVDLFLRILEAGVKVWGHTDIVQLYRRHDQNVTLDTNRSNFYLLKAFKKSLDRRRKRGENSADALPNIHNINEIIEYWQSE